MKITWIEKLIEKNLVKSYKYNYSDDGRLLFIDINVGKVTLFPEDFMKIKRYASMANARLQYQTIIKDEDKYVQGLAYVMR